MRLSTLNTEKYPILIASHACCGEFISEHYFSENSAKKIDFFKGIENNVNMTRLQQLSAVFYPAKLEKWITQYKKIWLLTSILFDNDAIRKIDENYLVFGELFKGGIKIQFYDYGKMKSNYTVKLPR